MYNKTCIIVVGPTAVGKTNLSIDLAKHFNTSIISGDSRQCFIELNIGVAKPSSQQLAEVKHYFINSHHIEQEVNAALFEKLSLQWIEEIFEKNQVAIVVGGTGLYVKAFAEGLDEIPPSAIMTREKIIANYRTLGIGWLQEQLKQNDPAYFQSGEILNPQRMMRALEVKLLSGRSILSFRTKTNKERPFNILKIGIDRPRPILYNQINQRVDNMIAAGLVEEAKSLLPFSHLNSLQTVGYRELFEYFEGRISLEKGIELIKQHTRHYAKRQLTWFRNDASIRWFEAAETAALTGFINNWLTEMVDSNQRKFSE